MAYPLPRALVLCAAVASIAAAQKTDTTKKEKYVSSRFRESSTPFELTLSTNLKQMIRNDLAGAHAIWLLGTEAAAGTGDALDV